MNKKIISLILVVPFVFLYLMFGASSVVAIQIDVPVERIEITNKIQDETVVFDLAAYQNDFYLEVSVFPTQAKNRGYSTTVEKADNVSEFAQINVDPATGLVTPLTTGKAKIIVQSFDGGFKDSITIAVTASKPLSLDITLQDYKRDDVSLNASVDYDYEANIETGRYYFTPVCYPELSDAVVTFASSDTHKAVINTYAGFADIVSSGKVTIYAQTQGAFGLITKSVLLNVTQLATPSGITVDGLDNKKLLIEKSKTSASCIVEVRADMTENPSLSGIDFQLLQSHSFTQFTDGMTSAHKYILTMNFLPLMPPTLNLEITTGAQAYNLTIEFGNFAFDLLKLPNYQVYSDAYVQHVNTPVSYFVLATPETDGIEYEWTCNKPDLVDLVAQNEKCTINAKNTGEATIFVKAYKNNVPMDTGIEQFNILLVQNVDSVDFKINTKQWGIADCRAFGDKIIDGVYKDGVNTLDVNISSNRTLTAADLGLFEFWSSNPQIATIKIADNIPVLQINGTGYVDIAAKWKYSKPNPLVQSSATIECVKDGVNVSTYDQLVKASEDGRKIVLSSDIMLGKKNATLDELKAMTKTMPTTYNWKYHENLGDPKPNVRYAIEFKNNVYGNGYSINGDYIAKAEDKTGNPLLFKGPLNFVQVPGLVSVKGQDNIVFLVRTDNVVLDNVILTGCSDESIMTNNNMLDLSKLQWCGTVLEIMSNAKVLNSRIKNGRNNIRAFGGNKYTDNALVNSVSEVDAARERITVSVESCIISQAREFLIKIGSNNVLAGTKANNAPNLKVNGSDVLHTNKNLYKNADFYDQLVLTDMTVKNCILTASGLFSIGIDSNYAGPALMNDLKGELAGLNDIFAGWDNLGGTSFPSVLRLEGDIRFYDWKPVSSIESSTLVETSSGESELLNIDIAAMVNKAIGVLGDEYNEYKDIIYEENGTQYMNTSIFMFGGGKNYGQVVFDNFESEAVPYYPINANIFTQKEPEDSILYRQGMIIPNVIGIEDFQFYLYNKNSQNNYQKQVYDLSNGQAYNWIIPAAK